MHKLSTLNSLQQQIMNEEMPQDIHFILIFNAKSFRNNDEASFVSLSHRFHSIECIVSVQFAREAAFFAR